MEMTKIKIRSNDLVDSFNKEKQEKSLIYLNDPTKMFGCYARCITDLLTEEVLHKMGTDKVYEDEKYYWCDSLIETMKRHNLTLKEEIVKDMLGY